MFRDSQKKYYYVRESINYVNSEKFRKIYHKACDNTVFFDFTDLT